MCNFVPKFIVVGTLGLFITACGFKSDLYLPADVGPSPEVLLPPPPPVGNLPTLDSLEAPGVVVEIPTLTEEEKNEIKKRTQ